MGGKKLNLMHAVVVRFKWNHPCKPLTGLKVVSITPNQSVSTLPASLELSWFSKRNSTLANRNDGLVRPSSWNLSLAPVRGQPPDNHIDWVREFPRVWSHPHAEQGMERASKEKREDPVQADQTSLWTPHRQHYQPAPENWDNFEEDIPIGGGRREMGVWGVPGEKIIAQNCSNLMKTTNYYF